MKMENLAIYAETTEGCFTKRIQEIEERILEI